MNSRLLASGLLALTVSFMSIQARAMQFPDEIDITADVPLVNPGNYKFVKFFVRDPMERACSQTRIYRTFVPGMTFILK